MVGRFRTKTGRWGVGLGTLLTGFFVALALIEAPIASAADNTNYYWSSNDYTGYCGQTSGGYVVAVQTFMYTYGSYGGPVDDYFGSNTQSAVLSWQSHHGLQIDGCVGPSTWASMQGYTAYFSEGAGCNNSQAFYYYEYLNGSRPPAYYYQHQFYGPNYWYAETGGDPVGGPVANWQDYRFSDSLLTDCGVIA